MVKLKVSLLICIFWFVMDIIIVSLLVGIFNL